MRDFLFDGARDGEHHTRTMRLIKLMLVTLLLSFVVLLIPIGCPREQIFVANLLVSAIPIMIFIGVLQLRNDT